MPLAGSPKPSARESKGIPTSAMLYSSLSTASPKTENQRSLATQEFLRRVGEFVPASHRPAISNQYSPAADPDLVARQIATAGVRAEEIFGIAVDGNDRLDVIGGHPAYYEIDHAIRREQFESYLCDLYNLLTAMDRVCDIPIVCFISRGELSRKQVVDKSPVTIHTFISRVVEQRLAWSNDLAKFLYESKADFGRVLASPHSLELFNRQAAYKKAPLRALGAGRNVSYNRFPIEFGDYLTLKANCTSADRLGNLMDMVPDEVVDNAFSSTKDQDWYPKPQPTDHTTPLTSTSTSSHQSAKVEDEPDVHPQDGPDSEPSARSRVNSESIPVHPNPTESTHGLGAGGGVHSQKSAQSTPGVRSPLLHHSSRYCSSVSSIGSDSTAPSLAARFSGIPSQNRQPSEPDLSQAALQDKALENLPRRKQLSFFSRSVRGYIDGVLDLDEAQLLILQGCMDGITSRQSSLAAFKAQVGRVLPVLLQPNQEGGMEFLWFARRNDL